MKIIKHVIYLFAVLCCGIITINVHADSASDGGKPQNSVSDLESQSAKVTILILNGTQTPGEQQVIETYKQELAKANFSCNIEIDKYHDINSEPDEFLQEAPSDSTILRSELCENILRGKYQLIVVINNDNLTDLRIISSIIPGKIPKIIAVQTPMERIPSALPDNTTGYIIKQSLFPSIDYIVKHVPSLRILRVYVTNESLPMPLEKCYEKINQLYPGKLIQLEIMRFYDQYEENYLFFTPEIDAVCNAVHKRRAEDLQLVVLPDDYYRKNSTFFDYKFIHDYRKELMYFVSGGNCAAVADSQNNSGGINVDCRQKGKLLAELTLKILRDKVPAQNIPIRKIEIFKHHINPEYINYDIFVASPQEQKMQQPAPQP